MTVDGTSQVHAVVVVVVVVVVFVFVFVSVVAQRPSSEEDPALHPKGAFGPAAQRACADCLSSACTVRTQNVLARRWPLKTVGGGGGGGGGRCSQEDRMESFFLSETLKYLYLLFDEENVSPGRVCLAAVSSLAEAPR